MTNIALRRETEPVVVRTALESGFPAIEVSQIAEQESWRKEINRPLYHIHKWWATRLGSIFRALVIGALAPEGFDVWKAFYQQHDFRGRVVLDPFMGSGTTLGEALKVGAKAVGCDINPVSSFLVRQAFTQVSETELRAAFHQLESTIASEIRRYYQTRDPLTGVLIPVLYCFWVKTVTTPSGEVLPLFSRYVFSQDAYPKKKPRAQIVCPECWGVFEGRYDQTKLTCEACGHAFNPQMGPADGQHVTDSKGVRHRIKALLPKNSAPEHRPYALMALRPSGEKLYLPVAEEDRALYADARKRLKEEDLPLPTLDVRPGHNTDQARGYNYHRWRDFFNDRQLLCLGILLRSIMEIEHPAIREQLLCLFSSTLEFNNLFCSFKGEGTGAVRHMFSNHILKPERTPLENCVWGTDRSSGTFSTLFESRLIRAKRYLDEPFEVSLDRGLFGDTVTSSKAVASKPIRANLVQSWEELNESSQGLLVLNGDSSRLPIPDKSVDAVVTDPPYFDFVHYSELSDFFYAWLSPALRKQYPSFDRSDSSAKGEVQQKEPSEFASQLGHVFGECCRVLKDNGTLTFSFHHSRAEGWAAIHQAVRVSGMQVVAAHAVHGELRVSSAKTAANSPISLDAILVCRKADTAHPRAFSSTAVIEEAHILAENLLASGMKLSQADLFVIAASQTLVLSSSEQVGYEQMSDRLDLVRSLLCGDITSNARDTKASLDSTTLVEAATLGVTY